MSELVFINNLKLMIQLNPTQKDELICSVLKGNDILIQHKLNICVIPDDDFLNAWFLHATKNILFNYLPFNNFDYSIQKEVLEIRASLNHILNNILNVIKKTNDFVIQYAALRPAFEKNHKILVYNVDQNPFIIDIYTTLKERANHEIEYDEMKSGWDKSLGTFLDATYYSPHEMLQKLLEIKIKRVISINNYYLDEIIFNHGINFIAVCIHLKLEWVTIHNDTSELTPNGYLIQSIHHHDNFPHFCTSPNIAKSYYDSLQLKNISYAPVFRKKMHCKEMHSLHPDYQLFIYSNSRLDNVASSLRNIFIFYHFLDPNSLFDDFQKFYYAVRWILLNRTLNMFEKFELDYALSYLHFNFLTFTKYIIIEFLQKNSSRKILLFGDEKWGQLFPDLYQNKYLKDNEVGNMLAQKDYLQITFNQNYSYYENNPVHLKAILSGNPFLCFSPVVKLPQTESFKAFEYENLATLLEKSENFNPRLQNNLLQADCQLYIETINKCLDNYTLQLLDIQHCGKIPTTFAEITQQTEKLFNEWIPLYIQKNNERITQFLDYFFAKREMDLDFKNHPLKQYDFYNKITHSYPHLEFP